MSFDELNAELKYLQWRAKLAGSSPLSKAFRKEIDLVSRVRARRIS
jgi:hypothetical protein